MLTVNHDIICQRYPHALLYQSYIRRILVTKRAISIIVIVAHQFLMHKERYKLAVAFYSKSWFNTIQVAKPSIAAAEAGAA